MRFPHPSLYAVSIAFACMATSAMAADNAPVTEMDPQMKRAVEMIRNHEYAQAIPVLNAYVARVNNDADAYNYLGYATRKAGDVQGAFPLYEKALKLNPRHRAVHEYIGEAYLQTDNLPKAEEHLKILDGLCRFSCEEFRELKAAVAEYKTKKGLK